ncbi:MAG TPA: hypothetical protein VFZ43_08945 [Anaerolineales bacterium]
MAKTPLYEYLINQPSAPAAYFDRFVVGNIPIQRAYLSASLNAMLDGTKPSHLQLILGPNGNGKTLLNNALMFEASSKNLMRKAGGNIEAGFRVLFSHISLSDGNANSIGTKLARGLRRSIYEPSRLTYSAIAAKIIEDFIINYESPFLARITTWPSRFSLTKALENYDAHLTGLLTDEDPESFALASERAYQKLQSHLMTPSLRLSFEEYLRSREINPFMRNYFESQDESRSVQELNHALFTDLSSYQGTAQPLDIIGVLSSIVRDVGCKVLILSIDDFNLKQPPTVLLPIVEKLSEFESPKILLIISAIRAVWEKAIADEDDLSIRQKIHEFGNPIIVTPPSEDDIQTLFHKMVSLMDADLAGQGKSIVITPEQAQLLRRDCPKSSYRDAIKFLIDNLKEYIETPSRKTIVGGLVITKPS